MTDKLCDHRSVGIIARRGMKILLILRAKPPFGWACPAGHVDDRENFEVAAREELLEETGLTAETLQLVLHRDFSNPCRRIGGTWHRWKIYEAETSGYARPNAMEVRQLVWAGASTLDKLVQRSLSRREGRISAAQWRKAPGLEDVWVDILLQRGVIRPISTGAT